VDDCHFDYITQPLKETLSLSLSLCAWNSLLLEALILFYGSHHTKEHELREKIICFHVGWVGRVVSFGEILPL